MVCFACLPVAQPAATPAPTDIQPTPTRTRPPGGFLATGAEPADVRGKIVDTYGKDGQIGMIHVEAAPDKDTGFISAYYVSIEDYTQVYQKQAEKVEQVSPAQLKEGMLVEVLFTGIILESYPAQVKALEVLILAEE
ncbi:MAG: DUF3221 domain-containing protein [Chloroflexota bacterium]